jgi:hypothetical protein
MNDTYDAGYLPDDADCNQDSIRVELAYSHEFYTAIIEGQEECIAELEKRLSHAETMSDREQSIRDLEQQAKGVEDALSSVERYYLVDRYWIDVADLRVKAIDSQVEAKALKEGV